jgi:site-specific DNA-adenine methylase
LAEQHRQLFAICNDLTASGTKCLVSNADVPLVRQHFTADAGYTTAVINCRRSINSKKPAARTNEVIVKNY